MSLKAWNATTHEIQSLPHSAGGTSYGRNRGVVRCLLILLMVFSFSLTLPIVDSSQQVTAAQGDGEGDSAGSSESDEPKKKNALEWLYDALGILYISIFLILSFVLFALIVMNILSSLRNNICPSHLIDGFEANLDEKKYQEAYEMAKADESFLGNVLSAGLAKLSAGYEHAIEAMQEVGEQENMKLQHRLSYLALIGTISPMIGLFGTVHGMINSFHYIAVGGGTPDPNKLAEGISTALLTTLLGLAIAIPAIAVYNILRNHVERLSLEVGITSEGLMGRFENIGKK